MKHSDYVTIRFGTAVTRGILDKLGSPDGGLKIIHIAGTNGKGSTAEYFTQILVAAGKKTGTFTSPAVYDFYGQFRIDAKPVQPEIAEKYFEAAQKAAGNSGASDFEIQCAGIIYAFCKEGCEYAVIECGMGGLNDATNAILKKELAVITSISLEHTEYLGNTIKEICAQKAGIIKDCPAVICGFQPYAEARKYFAAAGGIFADGASRTGEEKFIYKGKEYVLASARGCSVYNAATAIEGAKILGLPEEAIYEGVKNAQPEGRVQEIKAGGKTYVLDGAHNPAAFVPLRLELEKFTDGEISIIFGCLKDKDIDGNLSALAGISENITAVECASPRRLPLDKTAEFCRKYFGNVQTAASVTQALEKATAKTVVVCGSFTLLAEAKQWFDSLTGKRQ